ncbi:hypothetical protein EDB84DRAFT_1599699 [Lactarius hengduanensis]|nr:hypothetical protein EDB84DRAFT_1599699 [Lactarius hengduanensis]
MSPRSRPSRTPSPRGRFGSSSHAPNDTRRHLQKSSRHPRTTADEAQNWRRNETVTDAEEFEATPTSTLDHAPSLAQPSTGTPEEDDFVAAARTLTNDEREELIDALLEYDDPCEEERWHTFFTIQDRHHHTKTHEVRAIPAPSPPHTPLAQTAQLAISTPEEDLTDVFRELTNEEQEELHYTLLDDPTDEDLWDTLAIIRMDRIAKLEHVKDAEDRHNLDNQAHEEEDGLTLARADSLRSSTDDHSDDEELERALSDPTPDGEPVADVEKWLHALFYGDNNDSINPAQTPAPDQPDAEDWLAEFREQSPDEQEELLEALSTSGDPEDWRIWGALDHEPNPAHDNAETREAETARSLTLAHTPGPVQPSAGEPGRENLAATDDTQTDNEYDEEELWEALSFLGNDDPSNKELWEALATARNTPKAPGVETTPTTTPAFVSPQISGLADAGPSALIPDPAHSLAAAADSAEVLRNETPVTKTAGGNVVPLPLPSRSPSTTLTPNCLDASSRDYEAIQEADDASALAWKEYTKAKHARTAQRKSVGRTLSAPIIQNAEVEAPTNSSAGEDTFTPPTSILDPAAPPLPNRSDSVSSDFGTAYNQTPHTPPRLQLPCWSGFGTHFAAIWANYTPPSSTPSDTAADSESRATSDAQDDILRPNKRKHVDRPNEPEEELHSSLTVKKPRVTNDSDTTKATRLVHDQRRMPQLAIRGGRPRKSIRCTTRATDDKKHVYTLERDPRNAFPVVVEDNGFRRGVIPPLPAPFPPFFDPLTHSSLHGDHASELDISAPVLLSTPPRPISPCHALEQPRDPDELATQERHSPSKVQHHAEAPPVTRDNALQPQQANPMRSNHPQEPRRFRPYDRAAVQACNDDRKHQKCHYPHNRPFPIVSPRLSVRSLSKGETDHAAITGIHPTTSLLAAQPSMPSKNSWRMVTLGHGSTTALPPDETILATRSQNRNSPPQSLVPPTRPAIVPSTFSASPRILDLAHIATDEDNPLTDKSAEARDSSQRSALNPTPAVLRTPPLTTTLPTASISPNWNISVADVTRTRKTSSDAVPFEDASSILPPQTSPTLDTVTNRHTKISHVATTSPLAPTSFPVAPTSSNLKRFDGQLHLYKPDRLKRHLNQSQHAIDARSTPTPDASTTASSAHSLASTSPSVPSTVATTRLDISSLKRSNSQHRSRHRHAFRHRSSDTFTLASKPTSSRRTTTLWSGDVELTP